MWSFQKSIFCFPFWLICVSGDQHLDFARAFYGVGCALGALSSTEEALEYLNRAHEIQKRFHASKHDIEKTEQEINWFTSKNKSRVAISNAVVTECICKVKV